MAVRLRDSGRLTPLVRKLEAGVWSAGEIRLSHVHAQKYAPNAVSSRRAAFRRRANPGSSLRSFRQQVQLIAYRQRKPLRNHV